MTQHFFLLLLLHCAAAQKDSYHHLLWQYLTFSTIHIQEVKGHLYYKITMLCKSTSLASVQRHFSRTEQEIIAPVLRWSDKRQCLLNYADCIDL